MAEGGYDFDNHVYDHEITDNDLPVISAEPVQHDILNNSKNIEQLRGELKQSALEDQNKLLFDAF